METAKIKEMAGECLESQVELLKRFASIDCESKNEDGNRKVVDIAKEVLSSYNRFPVVFDHGEGVYLYDTDGKEYLDFAAGIAVQAFGLSLIHISARQARVFRRERSEDGRADQGVQGAGRGVLCTGV